jgi:hypothetical protein
VAEPPQLHKVVDNIQQLQQPKFPDNTDPVAVDIQKKFPLPISRVSHYHDTIAANRDQQLYLAQKAGGCSRECQDFLECIETRRTYRW